MAFSSRQDSTEILTFKVNNTTFGIDIKYIDSVVEGLVKNKGIFKEKGLYSMAGYRDEVIPLIDMYAYLYNKENTQHTVSNHQIITKVKNSKIGLEVESIGSILSIDKSQILDVVPLLKNNLYMVNGFIQQKNDIISLLDMNEIYKFISNS